MLISQPILSTGWVCRSKPYLPSTSSFCCARWYLEARLWSSLRKTGTLVKTLILQDDDFFYYVRHIPVFRLCSVHGEPRLFVYLQTVSSHFPPNSRCHAFSRHAHAHSVSRDTPYFIFTHVSEIYVYTRVTFSKKIQKELITNLLSGALFQHYHVLLEAKVHHHISQPSSSLLL